VRSESAAFIAIVTRPDKNGMESEVHPRKKLVTPYATLWPTPKDFSSETGKLLFQSIYSFLDSHSVIIAVVRLTMSQSIHHLDTVKR